MTSYQLVSFVTSYARVMLYEAMEKVENGGGKILYYDTDSIVFVESAGSELIQTGETLGSLTDEVLASTKDPGAFISRAGFTAPKSYYLVYRLSDGSEQVHIKVKGITLHSKARLHLNEESMNDLISKKVHVIDVPQNIIYSTERNTVFTLETNKKFKVVTGKRQMQNDGSSFPHGFKKQIKPLVDYSDSDEDEGQD